MERATWARVAIAGGVVAALAVALQYRLRDLGRPDNGDWQKYAASFSNGPLEAPVPGAKLAPESARKGEVRSWDPIRSRKSLLSPPYSWPDTGTAFLFWLPGYALDGWLGEPARLDLRRVALPLRVALVVALAAFACALALRVPRGAGWTALATGAGAIFAVANSDAAVVSFLPTFLRESSSQVGWIGLAALLALPRASIARRRFAVSIAAALTIASATLHAVLALPILASLAVTSKRREAARLLAAVAPWVLVAVLFDVAAVRERTARNGVLHAVFNGLLPRSVDPAAHLRRLDLPSSSIELVGRPEFSHERREFVDAHGPRLSIRAILVVVAHEPRAALRLLLDASTRLIEPLTVLGAWPRGGGAPPLTTLDTPRTTFWRSVPWPRAGGALLAATLLFAVAGLRFASTPDDRGLWPLLLFCASSGLFELAGAALGDGVSGLGRHLFLARIALDAAVVTAGLQLVIWLAGRRSPRAERGEAAAVRMPAESAARAAGGIGAEAGPSAGAASSSSPCSPSLV